MFLLRNSFHIKSFVNVRIEHWPRNRDIWLASDHQSKQAKWMIWAVKHLKRRKIKTGGQQRSKSHKTKVF